MHNCNNKHPTQTEGVALILCVSCVWVGFIAHVRFAATFAFSCLQVYYYLTQITLSSKKFNIATGGSQKS